MFDARTGYWILVRAMFPGPDLFVLTDPLAPLVNM
jgi:hypothetical protein